MKLARFEQKLFRAINGIAEPAIRRGVASSSWLPASLLVLESTGFKSGQQRRTPLLSLGLGKYRLVSTVRGDRSFWVKNLQKNSEAVYYLGGKRHTTSSFVYAPGAADSAAELPWPLNRLAGLLEYCANRGIALAILAPN
jgi:hypothetical protein